MTLRLIRKAFVLLLVTIVAHAVQDISTGRQNAITKAIMQVGPAVASINVIQIKEYRSSPFFNDPLFQFFFPEEPYRQRIPSLGSGVVISPDGYIITNQHVIEEADQILVTLPGGKEYEAELIGADRTTDISVLKIDDRNLPYASFGNSSDILIGEWVIALGNPFGLFDVNKQPTATVGVVSSTNLDFGREHSGRVYQGMIQTDAAINRGNSGGPLCNALGEVIGINTFIYTGSGYSEGSIGIGFAIPIDRAREIAEELKKYGRIDRNVAVGFRFQRVDRQLARYLELPRVGGLIITEISRRGPADKAELHVGDVIYLINERKVNSAGDIIKIIEENLLRPGDRLEVDYYRDGKMNKTSLRLEKRA
ncbi:MAG: trypsin-like peptidase domain-containing protein [Candidatus Neomarinimicrobiota bacterium]|nr:trypsin-like peptidase domain-containing protein [Candidatus Neomarinimicrobiota bacterium]